MSKTTVTMQPTRDYRFWVIRRDSTGTESTVMWDRLTEREAKAMYRTTDKNMPAHVVRYGWGTSDEIIA